MKQWSIAEYLHFAGKIDMKGISQDFSAVILIDKTHEYDTVVLNATQLQHHKLKPRDGCLKPPKVKFEKIVAGCGIYRASRVFVNTAL